jgi:hypothetical protein
MRWWPEPTAGDISWCHFPDHVHPNPKPRPGLITLTKEDDEGRFFVSVAYGTSKKTNRLYSGEFRITKSEHPAAYASAGLSHDTQFELSKILELPYNYDYFSVPPHAPHGAESQIRHLAPEHGLNRCRCFCGLSPVALMQNTDAPAPVGANPTRHF